MARKTFISYKHSEAQGLRDNIIKSLGTDTTYYQGETVDSPDLTDTSTENIKKVLKDMMYDTSVTIVIISPNIKDSNWVNWEIEYSLKEITRKDQTSRTNGVVGVIMKHNDSYDWLVSSKTKDDGCSVRNIDDKKLYEIIINNRYNLEGDDKYTCKLCKTYDQLEGSYISLIDEEKFISNPQTYIENAYEKCQKAACYDLSKQR